MNNNKILDKGEFDMKNFADRGGYSSEAEDH